MREKINWVDGHEIQVGEGGGGVVEYYFIFFILARNEDNWTMDLCFMGCTFNFTSPPTFFIVNFPIKTNETQ